MTRDHTTTPAERDHTRCLRCNGTGTVFHATCGNSRSGEIEGYDDDCPQCGGSGEDEFATVLK